MAKPNYSFEKRQRDIAKKQKKEEKRQRKALRSDKAASDPAPRPPLDGTATSSN